MHITCPINEDFTEKDHKLTFNSLKFEKPRRVVTFHPREISKKYTASMINQYCYSASCHITLKEFSHSGNTPQRKFIHLEQIPCIDIDNSVNAECEKPTTVNCAKVTIDSLEISSVDRLAIKMFTTKQIGQICDSWLQVQNISRNIKTFFGSLQSPNLRMFFIKMLTEKCVSQGEVLCSLHKRSSFPLAATMLSNLSFLPDFKENFMNLMNLKVQSVETDQIVDGKYLEKICGILYVYGALITYSTLVFSNTPVLFDVADGWNFIAIRLNTAPKFSTAMVLYSFLDAAGYVLSVKFGHKFYSLCRTVRNFTLLLPEESHASNESLRLLMDSYLQQTVKVPDGFKMSD